MVNNVIDIQQVSSSVVPNHEDFERWAQAALAYEDITGVELTLRIIDRDEMTHLNEQYRKKSGPTNVLSFPAEIPEEVELEQELLGDIVICAEVVSAEAQADNIVEAAHWAHMVVHGVLHLLGYDHVDDQEALVMEKKESNIMVSLGFDDPQARD